VNLQVLKAVLEKGGWLHDGLARFQNAALMFTAVKQ